MSERTAYGPGEFCWVELASPDVDAAARFYGDLLGWERERYEPDPEGYWYSAAMGSWSPASRRSGWRARSPPGWGT